MAVAWYSRSANQFHNESGKLSSIIFYVEVAISLSLCLSSPWCISMRVDKLFTSMVVLSLTYFYISVHVGLCWIWITNLDPDSDPFPTLSLTRRCPSSTDLTQRCPGQQSLLTYCQHIFKNIFYLFVLPYRPVQYVPIFFSSSFFAAFRGLGL